MFINAFYGSTEVEVIAFLYRTRHFIEVPDVIAPEKCISIFNLKALENKSH